MHYTCTSVIRHQILAGFRKQILRRYRGLLFDPKVGNLVGHMNRGIAHLRSLLCTRYCCRPSAIASLAAEVNAPNCFLSTVFSAIPGPLPVVDIISDPFIIPVLPDTDATSPSGMLCSVAPPTRSARETKRRSVTTTRRILVLPSTSPMTAPRTSSPSWRISANRPTCLRRDLRTALGLMDSPMRWATASWSLSLTP